MIDLMAPHFLYLGPNFMISSMAKVGMTLLKQNYGILAKL